MHKIKEKLMEELYKVEEKLKKASGGTLSAGDLEYIHKLTDTIKNIDKIEMLEDGDYSEATGWMGEGRMYGNTYRDGGDSYARGRSGRHYVRGHYSREGGNSYEEGDMSRARDMHREGSSYEGNISYARRRRDAMGRYSRDDGKEQMMDKLEEMMDGAENDKQRQAIRRCMSELENL